MKLGSRPTGITYVLPTHPLFRQILTPSQIPWSPDSAVLQVACGHRHTLFLTASGKVYACGSNDHSQLGHELPTKRPRMSPFRM